MNLWPTQQVFSSKSSTSHNPTNMAEQYDVMTSKKAKGILEKHGIKMPWQTGFQEQVAERNPKEAEAIAEVNAREEKALEDAQMAKVKKHFGKETEVKS